MEPITEEKKTPVTRKKTTRRSVPKLVKEETHKPIAERRDSSQDPNYVCILHQVVPDFIAHGIDQTIALRRAGWELDPTFESDVDSLRRYRMPIAKYNALQKEKLQETLAQNQSALQDVAGSREGGKVKIKPRLEQEELDAETQRAFDLLTGQQ